MSSNYKWFTDEVYVEIREYAKKIGLETIYNNDACMMLGAIQYYKEKARLADRIRDNIRNRHIPDRFEKVTE